MYEGKGKEDERKGKGDKRKVLFMEDRIKGRKGEIKFKGNGRLRKREGRLGEGTVVLSGGKWKGRDGKGRLYKEKRSGREDSLMEENEGKLY